MPFLFVIGSIVWPLFNFTIFCYFCLLPFNFCSIIFHIHFCLLSSIFHEHFSSLLTYFCIPYSVSMLLCPIPIFITLPFVHYFLPSLPNLNNSTFHSCYELLWMLNGASHILRDTELSEKMNESGDRIRNALRDGTRGMRSKLHQSPGGMEEMLRV